jgi:Zn-dependent protease
VTWLPEFLAAALASILAITLHEAAHGYAALGLGDPTAKQAGRLSLNPIRHIDPVGTILLPAVLVVGQLLTLGSIQFMFGWAKPVPVNAMQLWRSPRRSPRLGMALVAAAGPLMNFFLAWASGVLAHPVAGLDGWLSPDSVEWVYRFIGLSILANLVLGMFNLLPIPPLDGGRIMAGLLPAPLAWRFMQLERWGILIVLLGVFILPRVLPGVDPVGWALRHVVAAAFQAVLWASGNV